MDGMLSQEEINALLGGADAGQDESADAVVSDSSVATVSEERL